MQKIKFRLLLISKSIFQPLIYTRSGKKIIIFIIACQRSGTSIMMKVFKKDFRSKVYEDEFSAVTSEDERDHIRFNNFESLDRIFFNAHAKIIITKPLVELQNILTYFKHFNGSKAIWMYRYYKDVAYSNITHFGRDNGIKNLLPIIKNEQSNWRSENLPSDIRKIVLENFDEKMNPYDAAALFWYVRNSLFFKLGLDKRTNIVICKYEDFVHYPRENMRRIYDFMDLKYPGDKIVDEVHVRALGKGRDLQLSEPISYLCESLYQKMERFYNQSIGKLR